MAASPPPPWWDPDAPWTQDHGYLRGCDLFDNRFLWEAHEAWEGVWRQVPDGQPYRWLLQGLIQAAAGLLKFHGHHPAGAARLHARSRARIEQVIEAETPIYKGMNLPDLVCRLDAFHAGGSWPILPLSIP
jgi:predicted metal-dependent hydrolase